MTTPDVPDRLNFRCADADRQLVADLLNSAYAEGRITLAEHSERIDAVWTSKTFGDLAALTEDLTGPAQVAQYQSALPMPTAATNAAIVVPQDKAKVDQWAVMSTQRFDGCWTMPSQMRLHCVMGELQLDLTKGATMAAQVCHLKVNVVMGSLKIWVPEGVNVQIDVNGVMHDTKTSGMVPNSPDAPRVIITGTSVMSEVHVYGPEHRSIGQRLGITQ